MAGFEKQYLNYIKANEQQSIVDFKKARQYLKTTGVGSIKGDLCFNFVPKLFSADAFKAIQNASRQMYDILVRCIEKYCSCANFRQLFGFSKKLQELILVEMGYSCALPIARIDMFFNEENLDFKFFEFNADGASAMIEDKEITAALRLSRAYSEFEDAYKIQSFELFDTWVNEVVSIYNEWTLVAQNFTVAIVDFLDKGTMGEFVAFKQAFLNRGINCIIAEISALRYDRDKKSLFDKHGNKIDVVYRRAVTSDCMAGYDAIGDFLAAYRDGAVCVIGGFKTQVIHNKKLFSILHSEAAKGVFNKLQLEFIKRHIPLTVPLEAGMHFDAALKNKDHFIIKPEDLYGSIGVAAGRDCSREEWEGILKQNVGKDYILQEFCTAYKSENCYVAGGIVRYEIFNNTTGLYMYGGKLAGMYSRQMAKATTTVEDEGRVACSWILDER